MAKFLIIRFSSIGDIVLTTPVIRCLKKQVPDATVHFLTRADYRPILEHNPYIDKLLVLGHSWELMMEELKTGSYDYIIDLHRNKKSGRVKRALGKPSFTLNKLNIQKYIYTALKINTLPRVHIVDRSLATVASFDVKNDGYGLDYFIGSKDRTGKDDIPAAQWAGYIVCAIGADLGTKRWPVHKWKELCNKLNHPVILIGDARDREKGEEIASVDKIKIYNACGKFSLNESADLISKAKLVVCNDSGPMHIAAAYKKPVLSLWGNTVPSFGMTPYFGDHPSQQFQFQVPGLWCRPCSKIGYSQCPLGHFKCMEKIEVDDVLDKARLLLGTAGSV